MMIEQCVNGGESFTYDATNSAKLTPKNTPISSFYLLLKFNSINFLKLILNTYSHALKSISIHFSKPHINQFIHLIFSFLFNFNFPQIFKKSTFSFQIKSEPLKMHI